MATRGAPLENEELDIILELYEKVKTYLSPQAIAHIERKGKYVYSKEFGWVTPRSPSDHEICVYGFREKMARSNALLSRPVAMESRTGKSQSAVISIRS
jgi:hypothetical protein